MCIEGKNISWKTILNVINITVANIIEYRLFIFELKLKLNINGRSWVNTLFPSSNEICLDMVQWTAKTVLQTRLIQSVIKDKIWLYDSLNLSDSPTADYFRTFPLLALTTAAICCSGVEVWLKFRVLKLWIK
jgi:hypothetical protein